MKTKSVVEQLYNRACRNYVVGSMKAPAPSFTKSTMTIKRVTLRNKRGVLAVYVVTGAGDNFRLRVSMPPRHQVGLATATTHKGRKEQNKEWMRLHEASKNEIESTIVSA